MKVLINETYNRFTELTEAICYWLGYQTNIGRKSFIHEASLRYPLADAITKGSTAVNRVELESLHPLFKGKRVDLAILENNTTKREFKELHEFKIAKYTSKKGDEHQRVFNDIVRLGYANLFYKKKCYFLMCGSFNDFKQHFVGDKTSPEISPEGKVICQPKKASEITKWDPQGIYEHWFRFEQKKAVTIKFDTNDENFGLSKFKSSYDLNDEIENRDFYNSDKITLKTTCMAISPFNSHRTHVAGIWEIEMK